MNVRLFSWALLIIINLVVYYVVPTNKIINSSDGVTKNFAYSLIASAVIYYILAALIIIINYKKGIEYAKRPKIIEVTA
jgi:hypothetical protein